MDATTSERAVKILAPFDGDLPGGADLRLDTSPQSLYYRLRDARAAARAEERTADNDPSAGSALSAHWKTVQELAIEALQSHSKDIEIAAWLAEGLTRHEGLAGLAKGAAIISGLIDHFWDLGLFPAEDPDEPEARLIAVTGLSGQDRDGSLLQPLRKTILFELDDGSPVSLWQYERARDVAALTAAGKKPQSPLPGIPAFEVLESAAQRNGRASLTAVGNDVTAALNAWRAIEESVVRVAGGTAAPSTGRVTALLETLRKTAVRYVAITDVAPAGADTIADGPAVEAEPPALPTTAQTGASRETMLGQILQIAEIFRRAEPNSPLSYTLEEAVRRARLSLPELLREMMPELAQRSSLLNGLGIRPPAE
jgi:type VI secretion system protein ImpA